MQRLQALLRHPRTRDTRMQPIGRRWSFRYRGRARPGLHRTLEARWVRPGAAARRASTGLGGTVRPSSRARGRHVDRELTALARTGRLTARGLRCPYSVAARDWLRAHGLRAVAAQVPLVSLTHGWATAVDLLAVRGRTLYVIEVKTGRAAMRAGGGRLAPPLHHVADTDRARHQLQLLLMCELLRHEYGIPTTGVLLYLQQSAATGRVRATGRGFEPWCRSADRRREIWEAQ